MPIQFACPSCARGYSVKDELSGKSAKCGQCGHKMTIPAAAASAAVAAAATRSAANVATKPAVTKTTATKPAATKTATVKPGAAKPAAAKAKPARPAAPDPGTSSWLDEELESARVAVKAKPAAPPSDASCPSCNQPIAQGAVICVKCGYDKRIRGRRSVEHVDEDKAAPQRSKLGHMGSLLRGSFFSFLGAMLGATIWAVLCYLTLYEFSIVAWGLGGLAGFGMALGHEDDDGTFAGIIAAFMSIFGIIAAKVFTVIIFVAAAVTAAVSEMPLDADGQGFDVVEIQRAALANSIALKELEAGGESIANVDEARWEEAVAKARGEVAALTPAEIETRLNELDQEPGLDGEVEDFDEDATGEEGIDGEEMALADEDAAFEDEATADGEEEVTFGSVVGSLFGPIDGLWILLAFFTAYKVGAGQADD